MEPIANETWRSFMRSYYRSRLLLLLSSLGEAYVGQLARMLRIPHGRVVALLEGDPDQGYSVGLALVPLGLARRKDTLARGRAYEITTKGRRKARSVTSSVARRAPQRAPAVAPVPEAPAATASVRWSVELTGERTSASWSVAG